MPMTPITMPCTMKMRTTEPGAAPTVRRIAMSACRSATATTRVEMMLIAATRMISARMMNITRFSSSTAWKKAAWLRVQSARVASGGSFGCSARATPRAANRSSSLRRTPLTSSPNR